MFCWPWQLKNACFAHLLASTRLPSEISCWPSCVPFVDVDDAQRCLSAPTTWSGELVNNTQETSSLHHSQPINHDDSQPRSKTIQKRYYNSSTFTTVVHLHHHHQPQTQQQQRQYNHDNNNDNDSTPATTNNDDDDDGVAATHSCLRGMTSTTDEIARHAISFQQ